MHDIQERDIQVGVEMAWHGLTEVVEKITEDNCGIIYPMAMQPLLLPDGTETDFQILVAGDDKLPIGQPVTDVYQLIPNRDIWQATIDSLNYTEHEIVSCGTVSDRTRGFISVKLDGSEFNAAGREQEAVLNLLWCHGGIGKLIAKTGITTVVCRNTFNLAMLERGEFSFSVSHKGNTQLKLDNMQYAIKSHLHTVNEFTEVLNRMADTKMTHGQAKQFFAGFVVPTLKEEVSTRSKNQIEKLEELFFTGSGNSGENRADAFNAITDYYTHYSAGGLKSARKQFESSEFGDGQKRKMLAYELLDNRKVAKFGDLKSTMQRGFKVLQAA